MKRILFAIFLFAAAPAWSEPTQILIRPKPGIEAGGLAALAKRLEVPDSAARYLGRGNVRLWTTSKSPGEAESILREYRRSVAFDIVVGDYRDMVWPVSPRAPLSARVQRNLEILKSRDNSRRIQVLQIREREIAAAFLRRGLAADKVLPAPASLRWQLFSDVSFTSTRTAWRVHDRRGERLGYVGDLDISKKNPGRYFGGFGAATFFDGNLYGRFEHGKSIYQVIPLGEGYHAAVEVDVARVPEDQPDLPVMGDPPGDLPDNPFGGYCGGDSPDRPVLGDGPGDLPDQPVMGDGPGDLPDLPVMGDPPGDLPDVGYCASACVPVFTARGSGCNEGPRTCAIVRIGVGFTDEALAKLPQVIDAATVRWNVSIPADADHYAQFLIDLTAASFARSGIHARVKLAGVGRFSKLESPPDATKLLLELRDRAQSADVQPVWNWRNATRSDLVMLLSALDRRVVPPRASGAPTVQRIAGLSPPWTPNPKSEDAYSIIEIGSGDSNLSFLHELGHHFGALHDAVIPEMPFWYGRGFRQGCDWRTVMAYAPDRGCPKGVPRLAMWSSCSLWYRGVTAEGVPIVGGVPVGGPLNNNVRVINERAGRLGSFRP